MAAARQPTDDDLARAWRELHGPDWLSLHELQMAASRYGLVRARATALANGQQPDASPAAQLVKHVPRPEPWPPAPPGGHHPHRRRDDGAIDHKLAAAGEYARHDDSE